MNLNFRGISRVISAFITVLGAVMFPSAIVALIYHEKEIFIFAAVGTALIILGQVLIRHIKPSPIQFKIRDGFLIVFLCWIITGIFGALPYLLSGCAGVINSIFESFSGFTTTGATIFDDVESLPKSILFWRSFTQWIGGFGVVFIPIALLPSLGIEGSVIVRAEMSGTYVNRVKPKLSDTARRMFLILTILTLMETVCLLIGGLNFFDALTHSFTTLSTGGFTNYNDNLGHFGSTYVYCVFSFFMLVAGMDVTTQAKVFEGKFYEVYKDVELRFYLMLFALATGIIMIYLLATGMVVNVFRAFTQSAFHVLATLSTAGFYSADFDGWGLFPVLILLALMFVGGCISSTSGGIKVYRAFIFLKMVKRGILVRLHPNAVIDMKVSGKRVPSTTASAVTGFIFMYVALVVFGTAMVCLSGFDTPVSFVSVLACIGNIGPALSLGGSALHYNLFSDPIKLMLCLFMLAGRLELTTVIVMFSPRFWNPDRSR